ncbi:Clan SB, family S8, subtilisin-like serine peptidase [Trichomonas vaginalis G3]|uniref:Clan SB, family S8, subtilisin-like serine peptidase n=1 Tax=Trichomonas vaginalis (strain ATCC PRA-98 / G3) TaxID=412133 RepID=A2EEV4_TRIV3|nr:proprotein convertase-related family [Trichomonas vaginalis G3]EAY08820.1 Clan SB, family S8, subtilisin-like serine peptidase [Trichomonas vaginalis G3]KAI5542046.1 proprotein convertase-related family [Trichomonas vaginalis G3]|eukprot:XP_001321043.1 Clan SB, family S8, subtilisin-like serine peptidase [Trichomonas vaginalis G3]
MGYFDIHPLKEKSRILHETSKNGWYFITVLSSLQDFQAQNIVNKYPHVFHDKNRNSNGIYHYYLEEDAFYDMYNSDNFILSKDKFKQSYNLTFSKYHSYHILAPSEWKPFDTCEYQYPYYNCHSISDEDILRINSDPHVQYVYGDTDPVFHSRYTAGYIESGLNYLEYGEDDPRLMVPRPLEGKGLTGENQIVGVLDSNFDFNHTFFYDSNQPYPNSTINTDHRKVVQLSSLSSSTSTEMTHGTFMAGIVVGNTGNNSDMSNQYAGFLPKGKIHAMTFQGLPDPANIITTANETGAKVILAPFGVINNINYADSYDTAAYNNPETLFVISAGNNQIIEYPGASINSLTVATSTYPSSTLESGSETNYVLQNGETQVISIRQLGNLSAYQTTSPLKKYYNLPISETDEEGVIYVDKTCSNSPATKATLYVVFNDTECNVSENSPTWLFNSSDYDSLIALGTASINFTKGDHPQNVIATPSGPTFGTNFRKPDLISNGEFEISARANGTYTGDTSSSSLMSMSLSSSISAASVSGLAGLARQYFTDGYYPTGEPNSDNKLTPSSSLLRACLVNGAKSLISKVVDNTAGFGVPNLQKSLGFDGLGVRFIDNIKMDANGHVTFKVTTTKEADLSVTMAYLDNEQSETTRLRTMTSDIDLVVDSDTQSYIGNDLDGGISDELTTIEKVLIQNAQPSTYTIHLYSQQLTFLDKLPIISLAVSGGFDTSNYVINPLNLQRTDNSSICPVCSSNGECSENGYCECKDGYYGYTCSAQYIDLNSSVSSKIYQISSRKVQWFRIRSKIETERITRIMYADTVWYPYNEVIRLNVQEKPSLHSKTFANGFVQFNGDANLLGYLVYEDPFGNKSVDYYLGLYGLNYKFKFEYYSIPYRTPEITPSPTEIVTPGPTETIEITPTPSNISENGQKENDSQNTKNRVDVIPIVIGVVVGAVALAIIIIVVAIFLKKYYVFGQKSDSADVNFPNIEEVPATGATQAAQYMWTTSVESDSLGSDDNSSDEGKELGFFVGQQEW